MSGVVGYPFESAYGASKAAIIHLTKNAASENGGNGVRINAISPGWVKTNMMATILDSYKNVGFDNADENVTLGPMGRPGTPEEIANVAAFLCSEEASYANGSNFLVDGGMTLADRREIQWQHRMKSSGRCRRRVAAGASAAARVKRLNENADVVVFEKGS